MMTYMDVMNLVNGMRFELRRTPKHVAVLLSVEHIFLNRYAEHAEELAVSYLVVHVKRIKRPRLYITRVSQHNRMSRPCKHCCGLLRRLPQVRVYYTDREGNWLEERHFDATYISHRRRECGYCHI